MRSIVRVTRTYKQTVTEYVDVLVLSESDETSYTIRKKAQAYIEARIGIGENIRWDASGREGETYPRPMIETAIVDPVTGQEIPDTPVEPPPLRPEPPVVEKV